MSSRIFGACVIYNDLWDSQNVGPNLLADQVRKSTLSMEQADEQFLSFVQNMLKREVIFLQVLKSIWIRGFLTILHLN